MWRTLLTVAVALWTGAKSTTPSASSWDGALSAARSTSGLGPCSRQMCRLRSSCRAKARPQCSQTNRILPVWQRRCHSKLFFLFLVYKELATNHNVVVAPGTGRSWLPLGHVHALHIGRTVPAACCGSLAFFRGAGSARHQARSALGHMCRCSVMTDTAGGRWHRHRRERSGCLHKHRGGVRSLFVALTARSFKSCAPWRS